MGKNLTTAASNVAALPSRGPLGPNFDAVDCLERDRGHVDELSSRLRMLENTTSSTFGWASRNHCDDLTRALEQLQCEGVSVRSLKERETRFCSLLEEIEPALAPHEGDDWHAASRRRVSLQLAMLVDSFPTSNMPNPKVYSAMLLDDVVRVLRDRYSSSAPDLLVVATACRKVRRYEKFLPAISEILKHVETAADAWERTIENVMSAGQCLAALYARRDELKAKAEEARLREPTRLLERRL